jgi:large subunit ribosomal protein L25
MAKLKIGAEMRQIPRNQVKQLRRHGLVPVVVYGKGISAQNLQVADRNLEYVLHHGGSSQLVEVEVKDGGTHNVLVRAVQRHPVNHSLLHADFYAVRMDEIQEVNVSVHGVGKPLALSSGWMVLQNHENITIEALPADIPAVIEVDLTNLGPEHPISVEALPALKGVKYLADAHEHVFTMVPVVDASAEPAAETAPTVLEPEVVKKGKQEEEA